MDQERESIVEEEARWVRERGLDQTTDKESEQEPEPEAESFHDAKDEVRQNLTDKKISNESNLSQRDQQLNDESQKFTPKPSERMHGDQQLDQVQMEKIEREQPFLASGSSQSLPQQQRFQSDSNRTERDQEISSEQSSSPMNRDAMEQRLLALSQNNQEKNEFNEGNSLEEELNQKMRLKSSENVESREESLSMDKQNQQEESKEDKQNSSSKPTAESTQTFEFEDLISYLNEHKAVIEEALTEEDKKRIQVILGLGRDLKILYKDTIETIKADLVKYYEVFKSKWESTMQDLNKLEKNEQEKLQ